MRITIIPIGSIEPEILEAIPEGVGKMFPWSLVVERHDTAEGVEALQPAQKSNCTMNYVG